MAHCDPPEQHFTGRVRIQLLRIPLLLSLYVVVPGGQIVAAQLLLGHMAIASQKEDRNRIER
jgi:hypothetical protein